MPTSASALSFFLLAAFFEIAGCFAFWSYFRVGRPAWTLVAGTVSLLLFAYALTRVVEGARPDRWDVIGALVCIAGAFIIIFGRR